MKASNTKSQRLQRLQRGAGKTPAKTGANTNTVKAHKSGRRDAASEPVQKRSSNAKKTKQQICLGLLHKPDGVTIEQLQRATGWQPHSVRGFLSGAVKKKLGLTLVSEKLRDRPRRYRVVSAGA